MLSAKEMVEKSSYESLREENIKRNTEFLQSLGLDAVKPKKIKATVVADEVAIAASKRRNTKRKDLKDSRVTASPAPTRRSSRIQSNENLALTRKEKLQDEEGIERGKQEEESQEEEEPYYVHGIEDPNELDEFERSIYDQILRPWRLKLCKELEIEPYKIFRNRTLVEFIRRKRNDRNFAVCSGNGVGSRSDNFEKICSDLSECWGVGPTSLREDDGFAHQMLNHVQTTQEFEDLLHKSRLISASSEIVVDDKKYKYNEENSELFEFDEPHAYIGAYNSLNKSKIERPKNKTSTNATYEKN